MTVDIPEGFAFVEGRDRDRARALLDAADKAKIDPYQVKAVDGGYLVPSGVIDAYTDPSAKPEGEEDAGQSTDDVAEETESTGTPDDSWKNADIVAYAEANNIDLGDATKKADMLAALAAEGEKE